MRRGVRAVLPLAVAAIAFGLSFGVLARTAGMGIAAPVVMSATTFAGSAQFAVASILDDAGGIAAAIAAAIMLNARLAPMSIAAAPGFDGPRWRRLLASQLIVDESWALSARPGGRFDVPFMLGAGVVLYATWVASTALGVFAGDLIGDPERLGMDAAFPALFLALLATQVKTRRALAAAVAGAAIATALIPFSAPGVPIVAGAVACVLGLRR